MAKAKIEKITLSRARDIPFDKLVLSSRNVRRLRAGVSIEDLAGDIARRTLLQSLSVRAVIGKDGRPTDRYEVQAGGRRYRALELLVKQKRLAKNTPIPCIVREDGIPEEDSLAENCQRLSLHPLDQFRAFRSLKEQGLGEEEIAARFFVTPRIVKQRLKLASVSPKLLEVYADDEMSLEQLMSFTISDDPARQEQVWETVRRGHNKEPYYIRKLLTENTVRASDKRARFVGLTVYEDAGGIVLRDLFSGNDEGWLQDVALLEQLVTEKLAVEAETVKAEGWKWIEVAPDFPHGHAAGLRRVTGEREPLSDEEHARREALRSEFEEIEQRYFQESDEDLPEEIERRLAEIEAELDAFENRPISYDPGEVARAGAFVSIDGEGRLKVERGYVRPEDEAPGADDGGDAGEARADVDAASWEKEIAGIPEFSTSTFHLVTGLLLPIWRCLPESNARVYRLQTDDGERVIGRMLTPVEAEAVCRNLGIDAPQMSAADAWGFVNDGKVTARLADGLVLRRARVMNEYRVELTGFTSGMVDALKARGLFGEIVSWKLRLFVPVGDSGKAVFESLAERWPLTEIADRE